MAAEILTGLSVLRMILDTETDGNSPVAAVTYDQLRKQIEALFLLVFSTNVTGVVTGITETVLTDTSNFASTNCHAGHTLVYTSGNAKGNAYTIDSNTTSALTCTGDTMVSDGAAIGDYYIILYDLKVNADGHDHDGVNTKAFTIPDSSVTPRQIQAGTCQTVVQQSYDPEFTTTSTSYVTAFTFKFHVSAGAQIAQCLVNLKASGSSADTYCRITIGAATPAEITTDLTSYTWVTTSSINVSALDGFQTVTVELRSDSGTAYIRGFTIYQY
jgi:hypothetical protein